MLGGTLAAGLVDLRNRVGLTSFVSNPAVTLNLRNEVGDLTSFSQSIEARVGPLCSVFQLPVVPFPENPPVHAMGDYAQLRPYLTSSSLRWSYGAFKGTTLSDWQLALPMTSTSSLVDDIVAAGFCAVEVDRAGFPDRAARLDGELTGMLGTPISSTRDGRLLAWDLSRAHAALTSRISVAEVAAMADHVLHPLVVYSDHGTYKVEHDNSIPFQWTGPSPEIDVYNFGRTAIDSVHLTFSLAAPDSAPRRFSVHLPNGSTQVVDVAGRCRRGPRSQCPHHHDGWRERDHRQDTVPDERRQQDRLRQADRPTSTCRRADDSTRCCATASWVTSYKFLEAVGCM